MDSQQATQTQSVADRRQLRADYRSLIHHAQGALHSSMTALSRWWCRP
jgi:hypothetical protein